MNTGIGQGVKMHPTFSSIFLIVLLLFSGEMRFGTDRVVVTVCAGHAARIPEHTCHKQISLHNCHSEKCFRECAKETYGYGECRGRRTCACTFYCKFPPQ